MFPSQQQHPLSRFHHPQQHPLSLQPTHYLYLTQSSSQLTQGSQQHLTHYHSRNQRTNQRANPKYFSQIRDQHHNNQRPHEHAGLRMLPLELPDRERDNNKTKHHHQRQKGENTSNKI